MIKAHLVQFMLVVTLGLTGCSKQQPIAGPSPPEYTYDAETFWNWDQLSDPHQVRGILNCSATFQGKASRTLTYLQFNIDGTEISPFVLFASAPPRLDTSVSFSTAEIAAFKDALRKAFDWDQLAIKEQLDVAGKELFSFTNGQFGVYFQKKKDSAKFFLSMSLRERSPYGPQFWYRSESGPRYYGFVVITLDQRGVEKMLTMITNLPARRASYVTSTETEAEQERNQREKEAREKEKEAREKARADKILR